MNKTSNKNDFKFYAATRIVAGVFAVLVLLWLFNLIFGSSNKASEHSNVKAETAHTVAKDSHNTAVSHQEETKTVAQHNDDVTTQNVIHEDSKSAVNHEKTADPHKKTTAAAHETVQASHEQENEHGEENAHGEASHGEEESMYKITGPPRPDIIGWSFVEAAAAPLDYELHHRRFGWRVNDIIIGRFTDNVNNFQRGVLEVTRRTAVKLAEDISRTGSTASFNPHLENAMNWFMIKPDKFWFPSAESKYKAGIAELKKYEAQLVKGEANFYNRSDSLIPLLMAYRNLLGSCDDNLVKTKEDDGTEVSFFASDDYFFYAKGVAKSMAYILKAVEHDFHPVLENRNGLGSIHHAIHALEEAEEIDPIIILNHDLNGLLANHRANLATAISHGRFYLGVLITTLST